MKLRRYMAALTACGVFSLAGCPTSGDNELGRDNTDRSTDGDVNQRPGDSAAPGVGGNIAPEAGNDNDLNPGDGITDAPGADPIAIAPVPAELTGQWKAILTYVPGYYTGGIPITDFSGSIGVSYYFGADGQYQYDLNSARAGGFCYRTTSWTEWGTVSVAGAQVNLKPVRATNVVTDTCGESVLDDNAPTAAATLFVTPELDPTGWPMLRLQLPSGEELLLEKCRDCQ